MTTEAFSETLRFITNVKLSELSKKDNAFSEHATNVFEKADEHVDIDPIAQLEALLNGLREWPSARTADLNLGDIERYLKQARRDPGFPPSIIYEWNNRATAQFDNERTRFDFARLFGMLVNEWLESKMSKPKPRRITGTDTKSRPMSSSSEGFQKVSRKETIEQKEKLESIVFEEKKIDVEALKTYLDELFAGKEAKAQLEKMRSRIRLFAYSLKSKEISNTELKKVIQSVLQTDVLSDEKQATLKEFLLSQTIMQELASVLNMQLSTIKSWSWPGDGVVVEPRRHLNGRTRFYLDAEILTCLLLQYLGVLWSVEFKKNLTTLLKSDAWKQPSKKLTWTDHARRDAFFSKEDNSISDRRRQSDMDHYFMCQLPSDFETVTDHYNDEVKTKSRYGGYLYSLNKNTAPRFDTPVDLKQSLLHILSADIALNKALHGQCTVLRTDLEWFGPSLPFDTITTILQFFGMPDDDIGFMLAFLSCPVMFKDDPSKQVRVRKRGVPLSYMFSTLFGELVMFVMDFAVNQKSDGLFLHRIHDDFWLWDTDEHRCVAAWNEMKQYASIAGLSFNMEKTGSAVIGKDTVHEDLPPGDVRWGFLAMDASTNGRFKVDQVMIDHHIAELRRQLASTDSVFEWVQAYNKYMAFIVRNCGEPAIVYGKEHIDNILDTLVRIQKSLFSDDEGSQGTNTFATAIAKMIKDKFDVPIDDVPYGWYLWPNSAGGLEVKDQIVKLLLLRGGYLGQSVETIIQRAFWTEEWKYSEAKKLWESGDAVRQVNKRPKLDSGKHEVVSASDPFFSFEEFTKSREERGLWWSKAYNQLLERPSEHIVASTPRLEASLKLLGKGINSFGQASGWTSLSAYWRWIIALHHDQMVKKFGSLAVVDPETVPVGMVSVFKGSRMKWDQ